MFRFPFRVARMGVLACVLAMAGTAALAGPITDNNLRMKMDIHHASGFVDAVTAEFPLAYYRLRTAAGASLSGESRYAIAAGAKIVKPGAPIGVGGTHCVQLDGRSGYVTTTLAAGFDGDASLMAFVDLDALPATANHGYFILGETRDGRGIDLEFGTDNVLRFRTGDGSPLAWAPPSATLVHAWHWIVATTDHRSGARVIYWDGDKVADDKGGGVAKVAAPLSIGAPMPAGGAFFGGRIAEVALWNRPLTADDVASIDRARNAR